MTGSARFKSPQRFHLTVALILTLLVAAGLWWLFGQPGSWPMVLACWLIAINPVACCYYGYDKWRSRAGGRRVPEFVLHALAIAGGSLGAYLGMQVFRHKTIKGSFRIAFWLIIVLQVTLLGWIVKMTWWAA